MNNARNGNRKQGFTLIELLVVIAIIAILAAILFPVFAQARAKARQAVCVSNLKQIGLAMLMYTQDYDETFPTSWAKGWVGDPNFFVQPYMKNTKVLLCPSRTVETADAQAACSFAANDPYGGWDFTPGGRDNPTGETELWGYGFNKDITWDDGTGLMYVSPTPAVGGGTTVPVQIGGVTITATVRGTAKLGKTLASLGAPAQIFMEADTNEPPLSSMNLDAMRPLGASVNGTVIATSPCEKVVREASPRHNGGHVFVYADGHAKWLIYGGKTTNYSEGGQIEPSSVPDKDICSYFSDFDGSNNPGKCQTLGF